MPGLVNGNKNLSKNALRRAKKKADKAAASQQPSGEDTAPAVQNVSNNQEAAPVAQAASADTDHERLEIDDFVLPPEDPLFDQYKHILSRFTDKTEQEALQAKTEQTVFHNDDNDDIPDEEDEEEDITAQPSAKRRKKETRLSVAELKAIAKDPMLVEDADRTAADPLLLISIKAQRNVVPVPAHWSVKREYLSSKRGIEKSSFTLPKFIQDTGIQEMRDAVLEKQGDATLKQKQRERVQPKVGKMDLDYNKLYDAFFRHQTKPVLTRYGEVYFEGKENEVNGKHLRPGELSNELREALGLGLTAPPPWLYQQQRFGPPPGYPGMSIPGLNAPIPYGASWGYEPNEWGRPPTDEFGTPVFGGYLDDAQAPQTAQQPQQPQEPVDKTLWGELHPPDESEEEEEDDEEDEDEEEDTTRVPPGNTRGGLQTPSGTFTPSGFATTGTVDVGGIQSVGGDFMLRKGRGDPAPPSATTSRSQNGGQRSAYEVIPEQSISNAGFFGGERAYDLSKHGSRGDVPVLGRDSGHAGRKRKAGDVEVSVDVDHLGGDGGMSKEEMRRRYDDAAAARDRGGNEQSWRSGGGGRVNQEDLSSMIDEESSKRLKKDRENAERRRQGR